MNVKTSSAVRPPFHRLSNWSSPSLMTAAVAAGPQLIAFALPARPRLRRPSACRYSRLTAAGWGCPTSGCWVMRRASGSRGAGQSLDLSW